MIDSLVQNMKENIMKTPHSFHVHIWESMETKDVLDLMDFGQN